MSDGIMLSIGEDGIAREYDDTYDITIHCESIEEQEEAIRALGSKIHWIPCSERLPEENTIVLATTADFMYIVEFEVYSNGHMYWNEVNEYRSIADVIAWMPLPEPYKGE